MLRYIIIFSILIWSCGAKTERPNILTQQSESTDTAQMTSMAFPIEMDITTQYGSFKVEEVKRGKQDPDFWDKGLTDVRYKIYENDSLLYTIEIVLSDFSYLFNEDFGENAKIWESQILNIDTTKRIIVITNNLGKPNSDNETNVLCISDFAGNKSYMNSSPGCVSGTNFTFNKIVTCEGVYDYTKPIMEYRTCCTVFSDLINSNTLLYIIDWNGNQDKDNSFLIDLHTKDTLDRFVFKDFYMELYYSALIVHRKDFGILALLNSEKSELITLDTLLNKRTYNLKKMKQDESDAPATMKIEMHGETIDKIIIEFDNKMRPIRWNI